MSLPQVEPDRYAELLTAKKQRVLTQFSEFDLPDIDLYPSPPEHYRMRAEFRTWHDGDDLNYVMFEPGDNRSPIKITHCPMVSKTIHEMMFLFLEQVSLVHELRYRLFQIDFLSTLSGELLISMLYH